MHNIFLVNDKISFFDKYTFLKNFLTYHLKVRS